MNGFVFYRGRSLINSEPIVGIAILRSENVKTGNVVQCYIMPDAPVLPTQMARQGLDEAVCGGCALRPALKGGCYVVLSHGPLSVWKAFRAGLYQDLTHDLYYAARLLDGRKVRLGAWGDPAAIPAGVWRQLLAFAAGWTGFTHQWRGAGAGLQDLCMASCDDPRARAEAKARGFRTFRIRLAEEPVAPGEAVCPAAEEAGNKLTCATCGYCNGRQGNRKGDVTIVVHGLHVKHYVAWRKEQPYV